MLVLILALAAAAASLPGIPITFDDSGWRVATTYTIPGDVPPAGPKEDAHVIQAGWTLTGLDGRKFEPSVGSPDCGRAARAVGLAFTDAKGAVHERVVVRHELVRAVVAGTIPVSRGLRAAREGLVAPRCADRDPLRHRGPRMDLRRERHGAGARAGRRRARRRPLFAHLLATLRCLVGRRLRRRLRDGRRRLGRDPVPERGAARQVRGRLGRSARASRRRPHRRVPDHVARRNAGAPHVHPDGPGDVPRLGACGARGSRRARGREGARFAALQPGLRRRRAPRVLREPGARIRFARAARAGVRRRGRRRVRRGLVGPVRGFGGRAHRRGARPPPVQLRHRVEREPRRAAPEPARDRRRLHGAGHRARSTPRARPGAPRPRPGVRDRTRRGVRRGSEAPPPRLRRAHRPRVRREVEPGRRRRAWSSAACSRPKPSSPHSSTRSAPSFARARSATSRAASSSAISSTVGGWRTRA